MSRIIGTIEGCDIIEEQEEDDNCVHWIAKMAIDNDGSDNRQHDPNWQRDTSLHHHGQPIDSESVPGIVVPPLIINSVEGVVLGCMAFATYRGKTVEAVVFDIGPKHKLGEGSPELARRLGINPSALNGGVDEHEVAYQICPDTPAIIDEVVYNLQPAK